MTRFAPQAPIPHRPVVERLAPVLALGWVAFAAQAQDVVWRCGQTLTNQAPMDEAAQRLCVQVSLPNATTVQGARPTPIAPTQGMGSPMAGRDRTGTVQVASDEQRQRDGQAKALLIAEKERVQAQLQTARRQGDAARVALAEADLASIERELSRLP